MALARVVNNKIVEIRALELANVPFHKQYLWRQVIDAKPVVNTEAYVVITGDLAITNATHVERTYTIEPKKYPRATIFSFKKALANAGLYEDVANLVNSSANIDMIIEWESAPYVINNSEFITTIKLDLDISDTQMNNLFIDASKIQR